MTLQQEMFSIDARVAQKRLLIERIADDDAAGAALLAAETRLAEMLEAIEEVHANVGKMRAAKVETERLYDEARMAPASNGQTAATSATSVAVTWKINVQSPPETTESSAVALVEPAVITAPTPASNHDDWICNVRDPAETLGATLGSGWYEATVKGGRASFISVPLSDPLGGVAGRYDFTAGTSASSIPWTHYSSGSTFVSVVIDAARQFFAGSKAMAKKIDALAEQGREAWPYVRHEPEAAQSEEPVEAKKPRKPRAKKETPTEQPLGQQQSSGPCWRCGNARIVRVEYADGRVEEVRCPVCLPAEALPPPPPGVVIPEYVVEMAARHPGAICVFRETDARGRPGLCKIRHPAHQALALRHGVPAEFPYPDVQKHLTALVGAKPAIRVAVVDEVTSDERPLLPSPGTPVERVVLPGDGTLFGSTTKAPTPQETNS